MKHNFHRITLVTIMVVGALASPSYSAAKKVAPPPKTSLKFIAESRSMATLAEGEELLWFKLSDEKLLYAARKGKQEFMVVNGKPGPAFDRVGYSSFSPDGHYVGYVALKGRELRWEVMPVQ